MNAKSYLNQVKNLHKLIHNKMDEIEQLKDLATKVNSCVDGEKVQGSPDNEKMAHAITGYSTKQLELNELFLEYNNLKLNVEYLISQIEDTTVKDVLFKKYILLRSTKEISEEMKLSVRWVNHLNKLGVECVDEFMTSTNFLKLPESS